MAENWPFVHRTYNVYGVSTNKSLFEFKSYFPTQCQVWFLWSPIATLHSLIQDNHILLDTPKYVPIFFTMQIESNSSQPFVPLFRLLQLNERDAKQKNSDVMISWLLHFSNIEIHTWIATVKFLESTIICNSGCDITIEFTTI